MEAGRRLRARGVRQAGLRWPLRRRPAAHQRRFAALPPAHDRQDARGAESRRRRLQDRHCLQRLTAVHRRCRQRRIQHPPLDHRERLAGGHRCAAAQPVLQHRYRNLRVGAAIKEMPEK